MRPSKHPITSGIFALALAACNTSRTPTLPSDPTDILQVNAIAYPPPAEIDENSMRKARFDIVLQLHAIFKGQLSCNDFDEKSVICFAPKAMIRCDIISDPPDQKSLCHMIGPFVDSMSPVQCSANEVVNATIPIPLDTEVTFQCDNAATVEDIFVGAQQTNNEP